jgi:hypothetical protein
LLGSGERLDELHQNVDRGMELIDFHVLVAGVCLGNVARPKDDRGDAQSVVGRSIGAVGDANLAAGMAAGADRSAKLLD